MTRTQYYTATSLDGFIADKHNSLEWLFQLVESESMLKDYPNFIANVGAIAMGSTTYEWIIDHSDLRNHPSRWEYSQPTWVFSHRELPRIDGAAISYVSGDVLAVHRDMVSAAGDSNIWLVGGGDLVGQFHDHQLLDEIIVGVASVTLGSGAPLLPRTITSPPMKLLEVRQHGDAFATLRYAVQHGEP